MLAQGLRARGWDVAVCGHNAIPPSGCDLIHVHHFGRAAVRLAGTPDRPAFVFTTHDPFAMNALPVGWKRRLTDNYVLRRASAVVALSHAERKFLIRKAVSPERICVIPNGIDVSVFTPQDVRSEPADGYRLLFVGQLQTFKGLDFLLEAIPQVRAAYPTVRLRLIYQTAPLLDHYRTRCATLQIQDIVEFSGASTAVELARSYSMADIVISPSLGECLSTVVLEAMSCGAPVIATDVGGIREQLDANTGMIVPPRDALALARAICALLADPSRRRSLGQAALRKARVNFNQRLMIDRHERLYQELLHTNERAA